MTVLETIVERRRQRLQGAAEIRLAASGVARAFQVGEHRFLDALAARRGGAVIAEIKLASPRLGSLGVADPEAVARSYAANGASALSVVVEPDYFGGDYDLLRRCAAASGLAAVAKDFIVDPLQIEWARRAGASAVLLVVAMLSVEELRRFAGLARGQGLVPLVETHDEADIAKLAGAEWELVGVNNRDLRTFAVDLDRSRSLLPRLPAGALKVAESGIQERADLERLRGFDAFLVGESLLRGGDPGAALRRLVAPRADGA
jgi:indole-3-glycerol phosphate synthase